MNTKRDFLLLVSTASGSSLQLSNPAIVPTVIFSTEREQKKEKQQMEKKILFLLCILSVALATDWTSVGKGKIVPVCGPTWDNYVGSPSASTIQFMNDKLYRILHYEPFFDTRVSDEKKSLY